IHNTIRRCVCEGILSREARIRNERKRAIGIQGQSPIAWPVDQLGGQRISIRVGGAIEYARSRDRQRLPSRRGIKVIGGNRGGIRHEEVNGRRSTIHQTIVWLVSKCIVTRKSAVSRVSKRTIGS